ncbi:hypothetical protein Esti_000316 [Eimeria stiedai]
MQHPQGGLGVYFPSAGLPQYSSCSESLSVLAVCPCSKWTDRSDNAYNDYYAQPAGSPEQQLDCHPMRPKASSLVYMGAQQQHLQQQLQQQQMEAQMQLQQQQQQMEAHMQLQHTMHQQLHVQHQQMEAHMQHQYAQQQMEVQLQQQQQQEERRQQQESAASAYASAFYRGPPSNPMPPSELAKSSRLLSSMDAAGQPQMYETADDALMRSLQQHESQGFYNNSTLSGTPRSGKPLQLPQAHFVS